VAKLIRLARISMSLFVAMLAFEDTALVDAAKQGVIAGSLLAGFSAHCC
jgi:Na+/H+ antiporter NhaA